MSNVVSLPFDDLSDIDEDVERNSKKNSVAKFMFEINDWCENQGIDISTLEYRHQAAVIMAQLQSITMVTK